MYDDDSITHMFLAIFKKPCKSSVEAVGHQYTKGRWLCGGITTRWNDMLMMSGIHKTGHSHSSRACGVILAKCLKVRDIQNKYLAFVKLIFSGLLL